MLGAAGFIGRHARSALEETGFSVVAVPRFDSAEPGTVSALRRWLSESGPQTVVNCAGVLYGSHAELQAGNIHLVTDWLEALEASGIRFVQIGSAAEYGPGPPGVLVDEERPARPLSVYGETKLRATQLVLEGARSGRVAACVLRVFNPVGSGNSVHSLPGRAARLIRRALANGGPVELGPLSATRDFVDVRDVAEAVVAACAVKAAGGQLVNVGSGKGTAGRELVGLLARAAGYTGEILEAGAGSPRSDEVPWQVADISRAAVLLGWAPRRTLEEAVALLWSSVA